MEGVIGFVGGGKVTVGSVGVVSGRWLVEVIGPGVGVTVVGGGLVGISVGVAVVGGDSVPFVGP